jgi:tetratricopeptide (TPR) repeat protein
MLSNLQRYEEALSAFDRAIQLNSQYVWTLGD